jgi:conjugal transfer/type IV secretion protein DotA/TraY
MGGLGWMAQGGKRIGLMLRAMTKEAPPPPTPADLPDEPAARFEAFRAHLNLSEADLERRLHGTRMRFLSYFWASVLMLLWGGFAPGLGYAPGVTAILPFIILAVLLAKMVAESHLHHHIRHRRLTPFKEWLGKPENIFMPFFDKGGTGGGIMRGLALFAVGAALAPATAWAQSFTSGDATSLIGILARDMSSGDLSLQWVQRLFPSVFPTSGVSVAQDSVAQMLSLMNTLLLAAASFYLIYEVVTGVTHAAHNGRVLSERYHGPWVPIRVVVGVGSVFPVAGYCMAQLVVIYITLGGYKMANEIWSAHVRLATAMAEASGPGLPTSGRWSVAPGGGAVTVPPDIVAQLPALQALLSSELCFHAARWGSRLAGETQNPPEQPRQQGNQSLRAGQRPQYAMPPANGTEVQGGRRWDYGQVCGSITWTIRPARATPPSLPANAPNLVVIRIAEETRLAEREQAMREFDTARAQAFGRLVEAVRRDRAMHWVAAQASQGFIPQGEVPDINASMNNILTAYGQFKSEILAASSTLSAALNRDARSALLDRVNQLGWAAAGAMQPALVRTNKTVVDRVMEGPQIEAFNPRAFAAGRDMQGIYERGQRAISEALFVALPNSTPSQRNPLVGLDGAAAAAAGRTAARGFPEIDAVRDLRTNPETSITNWMSRVSENLFIRLENMARLDATDPLSSIQNHGQAMEASLITAWATWKTVLALSGSVEKASDGLSNSVVGWFGGGAISGAIAGAISGVVNGIAAFVATFFWWAFALAALYSTVLPMLGYMFWLFAVMGCIVFLIEAVVGAAFWAFSHVKSDDGSRFVGGAQQHGYSIVFNSLFRPMLMVIGLILAHVAFAVMASFVNATFGLAAGAAFSGESFYGARIMSPVSIIIFMTMLFYVHYQLAVRSYSLITQLPDRVARWSGASGENLGEEGDFREANNTIVGGVMTQTRAYGAGARAGTNAARQTIETVQGQKQQGNAVRQGVYGPARNQPRSVAGANTPQTPTSPRGGG